MYHHLKLAESELKPSGKEGTRVDVGHGGPGQIFKKVGFTIMHNGSIDRLVSRIVYNVKRYGIFIPEKCKFRVRGGEFEFIDAYNGITWSVTIEKAKRVRYFNFLAEVQCSQ